MISQLLTHPIPKPHRNKPVSDPQRSRFYMLEREYIGTSLHHSAPREPLESILRHACRYYRIRAPRLITYNNPKDHTFGYSEVTLTLDGWDHPEIYLNRGFHGVNLVTLLHELAHYITDDTYHMLCGHQPKFVAIYMHLLDKYRVLPSDAFRVMAKRRRVRIHNRFKPDAIRG